MAPAVVPSKLPELVGYMPYWPAILADKPKDQLKRGEKLAIDLRKSRKKDLINSKRKLLEEAALRDEELKQ